MIYVPELWEDRATTDDDDKLSVSGGHMIGHIHMSNNKIKGLSDDYPPADDEASRWSHVKRYAREGPIRLDNLRLRKRVILDHTGLQTLNANVRINVPDGGGPEIELRQLHDNSPEALPGGIRIMNSGKDFHFQLGISTDDNLVLYAVNSEKVIHEVCTFTNNKLTGISNPIHPNDAVNKQYVDSKKPVISVWAASNGRLVINASKWSFGEKARNGPRTYPMLVSGRITHGMVSVVYSDGATIPDPNEDLVVIGNTDYKLCSVPRQFETPLELAAGDVIDFTTIKDVPDATYATVNILIELDI
jgi:hypothetical protein